MSEELRTLRAELEAARAENTWSLRCRDSAVAANAEHVVTIADLEAARKAQRSANQQLKAKVLGFEVAEKRRTEMTVEETARMPAPMTKFEMVERYSKTLPRRRSASRRRHSRTSSL